MSGTVTSRGRCPVCGRRLRVRQDGLLRIHYPSESGFPPRAPDEEPCAGSEKEPS